METSTKPGAERNQHIQDIDHTPVLSDNPQTNNSFTDVEATEIKEMSVEVKINTEIVKLDPFDVKIKAMKRKYGNLTISGPNDKVGYNNVYAAWQEVRDFRIKTEKLGKQLRDDYNAIAKAIITKQNSIVEKFEPLENQLKEKWKAIDNAKALEDARIENELSERLKARVVELIENGVTFTGEYYTIGPTISLDVVTIKAMEPDGYTNLLERVKAANKIIVDAKIKKDQEEQAERDRLAKLQEENTKKENELKERELELEKKQKELDQQQKEMGENRKKHRMAALESIGMIYDSAKEIYYYSKEQGGYYYMNTDNLFMFTDEVFTGQLEVMQQKIAEINDLQQKFDTKKANEENERQAHKQVIVWRKQQLKDLFGMEESGTDYIRQSKYPGVANFTLESIIIETTDGEDWKTTIGLLTEQYETILEAEKEQKILADQKIESERKAGLSDIALAKEFFDAIPKVVPAFKTEKAKEAFHILDITISTAIDTFYKSIENE